MANFHSDLAVKVKTVLEKHGLKMGEYSSVNELTAPYLKFEVIHEKGAFMLSVAGNSQANALKKLDAWLDLNMDIVDGAEVFNEALLNDADIDDDLREDVEFQLLDMYTFIGIDKPENHDAIVNFCCRDIMDSANPKGWTSEDVSIAFRRYLESK